MLWIFIIIFIMNILCESHIDVYVYMFMKKKYLKWHFECEDQFFAYSVYIL